MYCTIAFKLQWNSLNRVEIGPYSLTRIKVFANRNVNIILLDVKKVMIDDDVSENLRKLTYYY